jgi:hypothetical protein
MTETSQLAAQNQATFARHETFHPRYGWLRKAVSRSEKDPEVFTQEDATVTLGVGKNMVNAIRYWGQAFKLLRTEANPDRPRRPRLAPSDLGRAMFSEDGWDPYVETPGTLWVLHWWLLAPQTIAPVWWLAFNTFPAIQFTDSALARHVLQSIELAAGWTDVLESSVKKDADCLVRMYSPRKAGQATDDLIDCPFRDLGLIEPVPGEIRNYRFIVGPKPSLPDAIVAYAALDFMSRSEAASTMTVARLAQDLGSPGRVFKLTEAAIFDSLRQVAATTRSIRIAQPAGIKQVLVHGDPNVVAREILYEHYRTTTGSAYRLPEPEQVPQGRRGQRLTPTNAAEELAKLDELAVDPRLRRQIGQIVKRIEAQLNT